MLKADKLKPTGAAGRRIAQWRRSTARLQVLLNSGGPDAELAREAFSLQRQCERLAESLQAIRLHRDHPSRHEVQR